MSTPPLDPLAGQEIEPETAGLTHRLRRLLVGGLAVLVPVALTAWVLYQLFELMDGMFAPLLAQATGWRLPGVGLLLTLVVVLLLGWLSTNVLGRRLIELAERAMKRVPVGWTIYSATKSVLQVFAQRQTDAFKRVVLIEYPRRGMFSIAFVTGRALWPQLHHDLTDARLVFLPTTPNPTSGYLLVVPSEEIIDLPITVEEGVRLVISGGLVPPRMPAPAEAPLSAPQAEAGRSSQ